MPKAPLFIAAALLLLAVAPLPYGYYTLLRIVVCIVFAWAAVVALSQERAALPWALGFVAVLFNPIVPIHLPKVVWVPIDVSAGIFALWATTALARPHREET